MAVCDLNQHIARTPHLNAFRYSYAVNDLLWAVAGPQESSIRSIGVEIEDLIQAILPFDSLTD
jgi:hypothetical protein